MEEDIDRAINSNIAKEELKEMIIYCLAVKLVFVSTRGAQNNP